MPNYKPGDFVQLHPACDLWMRGVRFGEVKAIQQKRDGSFTYSIEFAAFATYKQVSERNIGGLA